MSYKKSSEKIKPFKESEIVFGLVGAIGIEFNGVIDALTKALGKYGYKDIVTIDVVDDVILKAFDVTEENILEKITNNDEINYPEAKKKNAKMDLGNKMREYDSGLVGLGIVHCILEKRINELKEKKPSKYAGKDNKEIFEKHTEHLEKRAYIIKSLKNSREVDVLRTTYGDGFYLIGVHINLNQRIETLRKKIDKSYENDSSTLTEELDDDVRNLILRDYSETSKNGQRSQDTYEMCDFFIDLDTTQLDQRISSDEGFYHKRNAVERIVDLIFNHPFETPTFAEYAMFMAFASSLKSADLSRQVGATICKGSEILSTGANECPTIGGVYWRKLDDKGFYYDEERGRDYTFGEDNNKNTIMSMYDNIYTKLKEELNLENDEQHKKRIIDILRNSGVDNITEYGRPVHAEMDAILGCARTGVPTYGTKMYVTTFPCHNCAKHIIAAGIKEVIYIEQYPKSKAMDMYKRETSCVDDINSLRNKDKNKENEKTNSTNIEKVKFVPFYGVSPHRYMELFAMNYSPLPKKERKDSSGKTKKVNQLTVRNVMYPTSYLNREIELYSEYEELIKGLIK